MIFQKLWTLPFAILLIIHAGCDDLLGPDKPGNLVPNTVTKYPMLPSFELKLLLTEKFDNHRRFTLKHEFRIRVPFLSIQKIKDQRFSIG